MPREVRDLPIGTKFKAAGEAYVLLEVNDLRAHVRELRTKVVTIKNRDNTCVIFNRLGRKVNISPAATVDEVLT